jgi:hypothetical protein
MVIFILNIRRSARIATDNPDYEKELRYHILCAAFKIMDNSSIIDAPQVVKELGCVVHQLIHKNDRIKM